jgi:lipopolysaccharide transport system permease protein
VSAGLAAKEPKVEATHRRRVRPKAGALRVLWQHRELVQSLTLRDVRSRYKQSVLGVAWALLQPLALMIIYTVVFSHIVKVDTGGTPYPVFSYVALLPWTFFAGGLIAGTECLVSNSNLITKIYFPREAFPISAVLGKTVDLGLGILVLVPLFVYYHIQMTLWVLMVVPVLLVMSCLLLGLAFIFSAINLFYRDIRHVMPLVTQMWMYMCPIIYQVSSVPKQFVGLYMLNPVATMMDTFRRVALDGVAPQWGYLGIATAVSLVTFVIGYRIFKKLEPAFAETV